jgi:exopolysaccharide production protein ExoZ
MGVTFHHAYGVADPATQARLGAAGVDLFFVISGFIIATIGTNRSPAEFLAARARRILPLWWIALVPWLFFSKPDFAETLSSFSLWPIYGGQFHPPVLPVGWSLCFEAMFYVAFALALATRWWVPLAVFAVCALIPHPGNELLGYLGSPMILEFLLGVMIARLPRFEAPGIPLIALAIIALFLSPVAHFDHIMGPTAALRVLSWGLPSAALVYGALCIERRFANKLFDLPVFIGDASYSIYLFHRLGTVGTDWLVIFAASLAIGIAAYWAIEKRIPSILADVESMARWARIAVTSNLRRSTR